MSGDKITYTWYVQNFGTFDATYSISGLIATDTYISGSNVDITCNTSDNSTDKTFCNNYVKTTLTIDGIVADASSSYSLSKAEQTGDSSTLVLTIEIIGTNQIYTGTLANMNNNNGRVQLLSNNINWLSNSSGDLDISVKSLSLVEVQDTVEVTTNSESSSQMFNVTLEGDGWDEASINVLYDDNSTVTFTPLEGYELDEISCTNGYTADYTSGSSSSQSVTINNNSNVSSSTCTATSSLRTFTATLESVTGGTWGSLSISVPYGGSNTVTITPSSGYKLSSISCINNYIASYTSDSSDEQTVTINNPSITSSTTCTPTYESATYTKTVISDNGYWIATYTCTNGTGTMTSCAYNDGTVCDGGSGGRSATYMCTLCSSSSTGLFSVNCSTRLSGGYYYGGGMSSTISC